MPKKPELSPTDQQMRMDFGVGVQQLRQRLGTSVAEMAAVGGVSLAHQYRIEAGERTADVLYLYRLMRRFGADAASTVLGMELPPPGSGQTIRQTAIGRDTVQVGTTAGTVRVSRHG